jgi:hypothetical protein
MVEGKKFRDVVQSAWTSATQEIPDGNVLGQLAHMHGALHDLDSSVLKALKKRLRKAQREFEKAVNAVIFDESESKAKEMETS